MEVEGRATSQEFGRLLRRHRLAAGLSQQALAERAGMSCDGISALERGHRRTPHRETLALLAGALALRGAQRLDFEAAAFRAPAQRRGGPVAVGPWPDSRRLSLPLALTSFVGREAELDEITTLVRRHRLVTIIGTGGVGKTQTALRVASTLSHVNETVVSFAALAPIGDPAHAVTAIASAIGVQEVPGRPLLETIVAYLKNKVLLLLLDNCEHVVMEAASISETILGGCPQLRVLATSREPLKASGEHTYRLPSLTNAASVELFADRAQAVDHSFLLSDKNRPNVVEICRRLDGIPLAIELAAARMSVFSSQALVKKLDDRFSILTGGVRTALPRQQTMRAAIDWSYDLLAPKEQRVFERLSVFAGGAALDSAGVVCAGDGIAEDEIPDLLVSLAEKSLLAVYLDASEARYGLFESFRQYAAEKLLARGEQVAVAHRHARASLEMARRFEHAYEFEPDEVWSPLAIEELSNWRTALHWALIERGDIGLGQRLAGKLRSLWYLYPRDGRRWLPVALDSTSEHTTAGVLADLNLACALVADAEGKHETLASSSRAAMDLYERAGDTLGKVSGQHLLALSLLTRGKLAHARRLLREALALRDVGDRRLGVQMLKGLAIIDGHEGNFPSARRYLNDALQAASALRRELLVADCTNWLSCIELWAGNAELALKHACDALTAVRTSNVTTPRQLPDALTNAAASLLCLGRYDEARNYAREALVLSNDFQVTFYVGRSLRHLAVVAALRKEPTVTASSRETAARIIGFVKGRIATVPTTWTWFDSPERRQYEVAQSALREELGSAEFVSHMAEGEALTEHDVMAEALSL